VMWKEKVPPLIVIEFVSGDGEEEKDNSPPPEGDEKVHTLRLSHST
jgi:hypothetical protein